MVGFTSVASYCPTVGNLRDVGYVKVYFNRKFSHVRVEVYTWDWARVRPALGAARRAVVEALALSGFSYQYSIFSFSNLRKSRLWWLFYPRSLRL